MPSRVETVQQTQEFLARQTRLTGDAPEHEVICSNAIPLLVELNLAPLRRMLVIGMVAVLGLFPAIPLDGSIQIREREWTPIELWTLLRATFLLFLRRHPGLSVRTPCQPEGASSEDTSIAFQLRTRSVCPPGGFCF